MTAVLPRVDVRPIKRALEREVGGGWTWDSFGPAGTVLAHRGSRTSVIVTVAEHDEVSWLHASIAHPDRLPSYDELRLLKQAVWGDDGYAYQVFPAVAEHVSIHDYALHLWGRYDGAAVLPTFGAFGTI